MQTEERHGTQAIAKEARAKEELEKVSKRKNVTNDEVGKTSTNTLSMWDLAQTKVEG